MHDAGELPRDLTEENESLRASMAYMMEQAERNHDIMCRHQAFDLEIVDSESFSSLVSTIFRSLPVIYELDIVTLTLVDEGEDTRDVMNKLGVDFADFTHRVTCESSQALGLAPTTR